MRELRNTKIIAVDHGYGNMKTANTVTPTGIKAYETEPLFCIIPYLFFLCFTIQYRCKNQCPK